MMKEDSPQKLMDGGALHMSLDEGEDAYKVADSAYDEMLNRGIKLSERPKARTSRFIDTDGGPLVPPNLQDLTDHELGDLYGILDDYYSYVSGQLADTQNRLEQEKSTFEFISSKVRLAKEGKQKDKDDMKKCDRRYITADAARLEIKCLYNLVSAVVLSIEAKLKLVSRSITMRADASKTGVRRAAVNARRSFGDSLPSRGGEEPSVRPTRARPAGRSEVKKRPSRLPPPRVRRPPPRGRRQ